MSAKNYSIDHVLDAQGQYCPMPIIRTNKIVKQLSAGEIIKVLATDPGSKRDFESWCNKTGNKLLDVNESDGVFTYIIEKK